MIHVLDQWQDGQHPLSQFEWELDFNAVWRKCGIKYMQHIVVVHGKPHKIFVSSIWLPQFEQF